MADKYGRLTSNKDIRKGSEFGGVDNIIAPPPHDPRNRPNETLMQIYQTDPAAGVLQYLDGHIDVETQPIPETKKIRP